MRQAPGETFQLVAKADDLFHCGSVDAFFARGRLVEDFQADDEIGVGAMNGEALAVGDVLSAKDVLFREKGGDGGAFIDAILAVRFDHQACDAGMDREREDLLPEGSELSFTQSAEHREQALGGLKGSFVGRLVPTELSHARVAEGVDGEDGSAEIHAMDFGKLVLIEGAFLRLGIEADAMTGAGTTGAAGALGGGG